LSPDCIALLKTVSDTTDFSYVKFNSINETNLLGANALHCVAIWGEVSSAQILIENGIEINKNGEHGYTPLHEAISQENIEMVKYLLSNGADPSIRSNEC